MEPAAQPRMANPEQTGLAVVPGTRMKAPDRVVDFSSPARDNPTQSGADSAGSGKRDWSSALDLVVEAFEAIRMADERAMASEEYQTELVQQHSDQVRVLEMRIAAAEKRAEVAENRVRVAEGWLAKFHDTIMEEFQRTFASRQNKV